jgi:hypothetical protein
MSGELTDVRRSRPIEVRWHGSIGRITLDDVLWAEVERSEKRQQWCIQDAEGQCLSHKNHIHGVDVDKAAAVTLALAEAMIRDGRVPTPEEARQRRKARLRREREHRSQRPSEIRRRQQREEEMQLLSASFSAELAQSRDFPIYEVLVDDFDFADPDLWRSNSFASLRPRLIRHLERAIAVLEFSCCKRGSWQTSPRETQGRLSRAREILALLDPDRGGP